MLHIQHWDNPRDKPRDKPVNVSTCATGMGFPGVVNFKPAPAPWLPIPATRHGVGKPMTIPKDAGMSQIPHLSSNIPDIGPFSRCCITVVRLLCGGLMRVLVVVAVHCRFVRS